MRKRITLLAVLLLLLSACQSQTEEATETTPPETEAPAVTESGETGDALVILRIQYRPIRAANDGTVPHGSHTCTR